MDELLKDIMKPGRYIGREWNVSKKDHTGSAVKFALCFPDLYEVGMSNLGIRILYAVLNAQPQVVCERCFAPAADLEARLRQQGARLFTLESRKPLAEFDIVGFSIGHELAYTNILMMLEAAGIPLLAAARDHRHPLVIAGGPCVVNPEPLHAFFDAFVIGEAEEAVVEIVRLYQQRKGQGGTDAMEKVSLRKALAGIEGVYVPSLYDVGYAPNGDTISFSPLVPEAPRSINKRFVRDLDASLFPVEWLVPYIAIVHDRITLEVMRGCPHQCRFCQARVQYYPLRVRTPAVVKELAAKAYACTGYEEIALAGLSVSDYPYIEEVLRDLITTYKGHGVSVSLPSMKPKALLGALSTLIASVKKTGLTFAPEVASMKLRRILGKHFSDEEFFTTLRAAYAAGYQHVKLYFMIGMPGEDDSDLDAIVALATEVSRLRKEVAGRFAQVNVSINTLIPKPHTPLQWLGMECKDEILRKQQYLRDKARRCKWIKISFHDQTMSYLEAIFSRGDRRLAPVVAAAFRKGARFDSWQEHLVFARWVEAFQECGVDPAYYLAQKPLEGVLPWDFLAMGIPHSFLAQEYREATNKPVALP